VVLTDYPDQTLVDNMLYNVAQNGVETQVAVSGYIWGRPVEPLLEPLSPKTATKGPKFDLILLSDLFFNHSEVNYHAACLRPAHPSDFDDTVIGGS
jgi:nicotinamide N-methyltransferase